MGGTWSGKYGPLLIAEIGGNHMGDFDYAKKLTELAISADVDYVKFQLYRGDTIASRVEDPVRNEHFKKFELEQEQHIELAELCHSNGIGYNASVWDMAYAQWIDKYLDFFKIGSGDLTAYAILKQLVGFQKPILLSTGLSTHDEVIDAVRYIQSLDERYTQPDFLAILQCTSMYPIENKDANLSVMTSLHRATGLPVGYSDHTEGMDALTTAVAMGAEVLEFHFTDTREGQTFRDHKVSLTTDEVRQLQKRIAGIKELQGSDDKRPLKAEGDHVLSFRRAVYPLVDLPAGTVLTNENLTSLRPNHGIDAREYDKVLGKKTLVDLKEHQKLEWDLLE